MVGVKADHQLSFEHTLIRSEREGEGEVAGLSEGSGEK